MSRQLVKRIQRKAMGGMVYVRIYDDGSIRARTDHPSNDPEVELEMLERLLHPIIEGFRQLGSAAQISHIAWNDDPPVALHDPQEEG